MELLTPDAAGIARAAALLEAGEVIAFPTDTVYGLAALASNEGAVERIFDVKQRPRDRRLVLMVAEPEQLQGLARFDRLARRYADRWWPGPLTLVLSGPSETVAVRIPDHDVSLALLRRVGRPLATTSANLSGDAPAITAEAAALPGVAAVIDGGPTASNVPSTILDLSSGTPRVIRAGAIPAAELAPA